MSDEADVGSSSVEEEVDGSVENLPKIIGYTEAAPAPSALQTPTQTFVAEELQRLLGPGSAYRTGALFLSYARPEEERAPGDSKTRVAYGVVNGAALREPTFECAQDLVHLIAALRFTANDLEAQLTGTSRPKTP